MTEATRPERIGGDGATTWVCPACSESVDAHFEICWQCQASRPDLSDAALAPPTGEPTISQDLECVECHYNVRGVPATHACPECGTAVLFTLFARHAFGRMNRDTDHAAEYLAGRLDYPPDAVHFVLDTYSRLLIQGHMDPAKVDLLQVDMLMFCRMLLEYGAHRIGTPERAREALADWRLLTTTDIGRILSHTSVTSRDAIVAHFTSPHRLLDLLP